MHAALRPRACGAQARTLWAVVSGGDPQDVIAPALTDNLGLAALYRLLLDHVRCLKCCAAHARCVTRQAEGRADHCGQASTGRISHLNRWCFFLMNVSSAVFYARAAIIDKQDATNFNLQSISCMVSTLRMRLPAQAHKPIAASLRLFADAENFPILVHCVHGKDRTGLIAMLLLGLLDVDEQAGPPIFSLCPSRQPCVAYPTRTVALCLETNVEVCQAQGRLVAISCLPLCMAHASRICLWFATDGWQSHMPFCV